MEEVTIRRAEHADLDRLVEFEQAIIETERPFDVTIRDGKDVHYYDLAALVALPNAHVVVAEIDSKIVGSGYARIDESEPYLKHQKHSYLGFMYVVPEHRGKGVNKKVVDALEVWSLSQGVTEIRLEVYNANDPAVRAYEKSGYEKLTVWMRKSL
jgi:ribosomal protein S18 acetylase RimI-like enzyme